MDVSDQVRDQPVPLVVDLDGTLVRTDTLVESLLRLAAANPLALLRTAAGGGGRAGFKRRVAMAMPLNPASLVFNDSVRALLTATRDEGRPVYLVTAADQSIADAVATHVGGFAAAYGSDGARNLKGAEKSGFLQRRFGARGFDYAGDSYADLPVWAVARRAYVVAPDAGLLSAARAQAAELHILGEPLAAGQLLRLLAKALRVHQWLKNLLVLVPVLAAHRLGAGPLTQAVLGMAAFSLCASSVYVLNDLLDLPHDRAHARKKNRPFASGALPVAQAPALIAATLGGGFLLALLLPGKFLLMLAIYYGCTLAYSLGVKRMMVADVMMLAGLYTLRIFAGAAAARLPVSPWLLAFSMFLFFCLAVVKRQTELTQHVKQGRTASLSGRGYGPDDLDMLRSMAASAGYMAVLVMALYINSTEVRALYRHPSVLWGICPALLFWVSRVLMISHRGEMHDDPVVFAMRDKTSLAVGAVCGCVFLAGML